MDRETNILLKGIKTRLKMPEVNLEQLATQVDSTFEGINVRSIQEYAEDITAIRAYEVALVKHILEYIEPSSRYTKDE